MEIYDYAPFQQEVVHYSSRKSHSNTDTDDPSPYHTPDDPIARLREERRNLDKWAEKLSAPFVGDPQCRGSGLKEEGPMLRPPFEEKFTKLKSKQEDKFLAGENPTPSTAVLAVEMENQRLSKMVDALTTKLRLLGRRQSEDHEQSREGFDKVERENERLIKQLSRIESENQNNVLVIAQQKKKVTSLSNNLTERRSTLQALANERDEMIRELVDKNKETHDLQVALENAENQKNEAKANQQQCENNMHDLSERYNKLSHHYKELQEQQSSYAEAMKENKFKLTALIQERDETKELLIKTRVGEHAKQDKTRTLQSQLQLSTDELVILRKRVSDLSTELLSTKDQLALAVGRLETSTTQLNDTSEVLDQTTKSLQSVKDALKAAKADADAGKREIEILQNANQRDQLLREALQKELKAVRKKKEMEAMEKPNNEADVEKSDEEKAELLSKIEQLESQLETAKCEIVRHEGYRKDADDALKAAEVELKTSTHLVELEDKQAKKQAIPPPEETPVVDNSAEYKETIEQLEAELATLKRRKDNMDLYVSLYRSSTGREPRRLEVLGALKTLVQGSKMTKICLSNRSKQLPRYLKLTTDGKIMWSHDMNGVTGFTEKHAIGIEEIRQVIFGQHAIYETFRIPFHTLKNQPPWRYFSLRTTKRSYDFIAPSDEVAQTFVVGLGRLARVCTGIPGIQSDGEFLVRRAALKLEAYCARRQISRVMLWKEGIRRTLSQNPQLLNKLRSINRGPQKQPTIKLA